MVLSALFACLDLPGPQPGLICGGPGRLDFDVARSLGCLRRNGHPLHVFFHFVNVEVVSVGEHVFAKAAVHAMHLDVSTPGHHRKLKSVLMIDPIVVPAKVHRLVGRRSILELASDGKGLCRGNE